MKRFSLILAAMLALLLPLTAYATPLVDVEEKVYDFADLLTPGEEEELRALALKVGASHNIDAVILTTDDAEGKDSGNYAADFFDENNFGVGSRYDGILLLINMEEREVYILESGQVDDIMQRGDNEALLDSLYDAVAAGQYGDGARVFLQDVDTFFAYREQVGGDVGVAESLNPPEPPAPPSLAERLGKSALGGFGISAFVTLILFLIHRGSLPKAPSYQAYLGGEQVRFHRREDRFVSTHTTRTPIPKDTNSGGGASRGGSNTFRSSGGGGGKSFGGGGRKF